MLIRFFFFRLVSGRHDVHDSGVDGQEEDEGEELLPELVVVLAVRELVRVLHEGVARRRGQSRCGREVAMKEKK